MIFDKSAERRASKSGSPELPASLQGDKGSSSSCSTVPFSKFTSEQPPKQVGLQRAQAHQQRPADQPQRDQHDQYGQPQEPFVDPPYASLAHTNPKGSARLWGLCYSNGNSGSKVRSRGSARPTRREATQEGPRQVPLDDRGGARLSRTREKTAQEVSRMRWLEAHERELRTALWGTLRPRREGRGQLDHGDVRLT